MSQTTLQPVFRYLAKLAAGLALFALVASYVVFLLDTRWLQLATGGVLALCLVALLWTFARSTTLAALAGLLLGRLLSR